MSERPPMSMSHIGFRVKDLARMAAFYTEVLGFQVTDRGVARGQPIVFLSREAGEHHQVVLVQSRGADEATTINQISFRLDDLDGLRHMHRLLLAARVKELNLVDHCLAWSVYCHDPEGNRLEFFVDAPYYVCQPIIEALDLSQTDEEIRETTRRRFSGDPTFRAFDAWRGDFAESLGKTAP